MTFDVPGDAYDTFMGRFARVLAPAFADFSGIHSGLTVLDVGCGSGFLTVELARRHGGRSVAPVNQSTLVEACAARVPEVDVRTASAEALPWPADSFDAALAQLVLHFLDEPVVGLAEMRRVVRPGGVVAACSWNFPEMTLLRTFWQAAREVVPTAPSETLQVGTLAELAELGREAGLENVEATVLDVSAGYESVEELWGSFQLGVGPAGQFCVSLVPETREAVRQEYLNRLGNPSGSFTLDAQAWAVRGNVP